MSGRTCMKCRLHGKIVPLKGHKRNCPYTNCNCLRCASHDNYLEKGNSKRSENSDKGLQWRQNLNAEIEAKSGSPRGFITCSTSTSTQTSTQTSTSVSVVQFPKPRKEEDSHFALQLADLMTAKSVVDKKKTLAEKRKEKQRMQLQRHRTLYNSVNQYAKQVSSYDENLNPVTVLKTAIQLHQLHPKASEVKKETLPIIQPHVGSLLAQNKSNNFNDKITSLRQVLPTVPEAKLAALLAGNGGDMDAVVQEILETTPDEENSTTECSTTTIVDLEAEEESKHTEVPALKSALNCDFELLAKLQVDKTILKDILTNVKANSKEREKDEPRIISFNKLDDDPQLVSISTPTEENKRKCPQCQRLIAIENCFFCCYCGAVLDKQHIRC